MYRERMVDFKAVYESVERRRREFLEVFEQELSLVAESYGGLYSLIAMEEDLTCMTAKKVGGKRDKSWGAAQL